MEFTIQTEGTATVVKASGMLAGSILPEQREQLFSAIKPGCQIIFDFAGVDGASGLGGRQLLLLVRHIHAVGGSVSVRGTSEKLTAISEASGFHELFRRTPQAPIARVAVPLTPRTDAYPTHAYGGFGLRPGFPMPLGATPVSQGINFAVFSRHATTCTLVLSHFNRREQPVEIPFPPEFRIGDVFAMTVFGLDPEDVEYGYRMDGPFNPGDGHRFDRQAVLLDPMTRMIVGRETWGTPRPPATMPLLGRITPEDYDWEGDHPLGLPFEDLVIYEVHVRGFTRSETSGVKFPGTFAGLREKIPYLVDLGINCVELLPIFEFDEREFDRINPLTGQTIVNYWGYSTLAFFAPKAGYAATGALGLQADELKTLVKELHRNGIEMILDVVFNHTAEGGDGGPTLSFRGLDNRTYYMLTPSGEYYNFSGCGNTLNCNHPVVRDFVLGCLRHWVSEFHIDGFRFDLASILGRAPDGTPLANPPLLEALAMDPVLGRTKLIAEAWDAGGLYQVGSFPGYGRWAEWNGKYRDCVRRFLKGDGSQVSELASRVLGSPDLYAGRGPTASINFVACHDGFTLFDLVSYNDKHNEANGEQNRDGGNDNHSWNCGAEGPTSDPDIQRLRCRQVKNALTVLLVSQGVPMLLMGDEVGRTQQGNNNAYCHDSPLTWMDWTLVERNAELFRYCKHLIAFRKQHPALRHPHHVGQPAGGEMLQVVWHGTRPWQADWSASGRVLSFTLHGKANGQHDIIHVMFNAYWEPLPFELPAPPGGNRWHLFANSGTSPPEDVFEPGREPPLPDQGSLSVSGRSAVVLVARP